MKRWLTMVCSVALILALLPMGAFSAPVKAQEDPVIVNVKDFGAVGDGVTDDRAAIMSAFNYAVANYAGESIPVTVYFPEGEYGLLRGGMYIKMPYGSGNLTVKGDGADKSTIVYLEEWDNGGSWVALRLLPKITPESDEQYLHDITVQDLGVYDTDPVNHAWHVDKGDPGTEETHGFNIQHCVRATIKNCKVSNVGDEAIDMSHCIDSVMTDNVVENSPGAGGAGGAISVGDGSRNVLISNNTVTGSIAGKTNWAIAVEALLEPVEEIDIINNTLTGINGYGINVGAPAGTIADVLVQNNTITDCSDGGIRLMGSGQTDDVKLISNHISNTAIGIYLEGSNKDQTVIDDCIIDTLSDCGVKINSVSSNDTIIKNSTIRNSQNRAVYNAGTDTKIDGVLIDGVGLSGGVTVGAITQYVPSSATTSCSEVTNTVILNCQNKRGTQGVQKVTNTLIEQVEISGYISIAGAYTITNCRVNRIVQAKDGCTIDGLVLHTQAELGTHAVTLSNLTGCTITNCVFTMPSRNAVCETGTADSNTITDNITIGGKGVKIIGENTVSLGNVTATESTTEQFRYRVVDGQATITAWLDSSAVRAVIPSAVEDYPVTAIDPWAFALNENLTSILIPDSITAIGANAFFLCDGLAEVHYPGSQVQWEAVDVGENNEALLDAAWHCPSDRYAEDVAHSVMDTDHGNGLAFRFTLYASGVTVDGDKQVDMTGATVNYLGVDCKLLGMGAVVTNNAAEGAGDFTLDAVNGSTVIDIPVKYLLNWAADCTDFAVRIIDIPDEMMEDNVYARPYYVIEVGGEPITVYGNVDIASCADYL